MIKESELKLDTLISKDAQILRYVRSISSANQPVYIFDYIFEDENKKEVTLNKIALRDYALVKS
jgi:hypothetical protein